MANGGIIGPVKVVCSPQTVVRTFTSTTTYKRTNCTATTAPESAPSVNAQEWSPSVENVVTRLVQNGMSNSGECPTSA